jgi:hypothetical protein
LLRDAAGVTSHSLNFQNMYALVKN